MTEVTRAAIEWAAAALQGVIVDLPVMSARFLARRVGGPVLLVPESLQRAGSFKIRGAYARMVRLDEQQRARGVVAASAGNHAQGVALAARLLGVQATVFMPQGASIPKVEATRGYGATVRFAGSTVDEAVAAALAFAASTGAEFIHPFDHPDVVAGQGTVGLEILSKVPDVRTVVVSTGGGGLLAGIAAAIKPVRPDVRVIGVQAEAAAAYPLSLAAGHPVTLGRMATMADGIAVGRPGDVPFAIVRDLVDGIVTVSEAELSTAVLMLLERAKLVVEPAGAAATAAVLADPGAFEPPVAVVVSGGNVDSLLLLRIIRHGLAAADRYLALTVRMPDRPGSLAALLDQVRRTNANVVDIEHNRLDPSLAVDEVGVVVHAETRGAGHSAEVLAALREAGYDVASGR